jgi:hypothetical protein|tara:strand:- start:348 stop:515 length:168 start_codon:yes stop_codon:yes gene_type:complete
MREQRTTLKLSVSMRESRDKRRDGREARECSRGERPPSSVGHVPTCAAADVAIGS